MTRQLIVKTNRTYKNRLLWIAGLFLISLSACNSDDDGVTRVFEVTFPVTSYGLESIDDSAEIQISFSTASLESTTVTLEVAESGATYGTDYETSPVISDNAIEITVPAGSESASFTVTRLVDYISEGNTVSFTLQSVVGEDAAEIVGSTSVTVSFEEVVYTGGTIDLETGGSTEPNQVYIDFSTGEQTSVRRDSWEIAFYNGSENRVFLNSALTVSAAELTGYTDITAVTSTTEFDESYDLYYYPDFSTKTAVTISTVQDLLDGLPVSYTQYGDEDNGIVFTDSKEGELEGTAIGEISTTDSENYVYVVSLGHEIPSDDAEAGSINTTGDDRGYMKIRILSDGSNYTLQYAEIDATTYEEVTITKDDNYNLTAFSLTNDEEVAVEPAKGSWDVNHSGVFSYYSGGFGLTYSDYGLHNTLGGTGLYELTNDHTDRNGDTVDGSTSITYDDFTLSDVDESSFVTDDRAVIASDWRSTSDGAYDYIYYVIKDADGNYFKMKYTALTNSEGDRGYSQIEYELL